MPDFSLPSREQLPAWAQPGRRPTMKTHSPRRTRLGFDVLEFRSMLADDVPIQFPGDGVFDLTFVAAEYTDMAQFHADEQRIVSHLLSVEPFKSRADQIQIHDIDNTEPLGVTFEGGFPNADGNKLLDVVQASGIRTDLIGLIVNTPIFAGFGCWAYFTTPNMVFGPEVAVHEIGHSLGGLKDEDRVLYTQVRDGQVHGNVYAGTPPAAAWSGQVAPDEYFLGANQDDWYRTSLTSVMRNVHADPPYNAIELHLLTAALDYLAGPSADHQAPQVAIVGLNNGDSVAGVVHVATAVTDDRAVTDTQLWVDGSLVRNSWTAPFTLDWLTGEEPLGAHTLQVKAFDAAGNVGVSAPVTVNLTAGSDFQIVSPAPGAVVRGGTIPLEVSMWSGGADHFTVSIDGASPRDTYIDRQTDKATIYPDSALGLGPHTLTVVASYSGPDGTSLERYRASTTFIELLPQPPAPYFVGPTGGVSTSSTVRLEGFVDPGTTVHVYDGATLLGTTVADTGGVWWWTATDLSNGVHSFTDVVEDALGNLSPPSAALVVTVQVVTVQATPAVIQFASAQFHTVVTASAAQVTVFRDLNLNVKDTVTVVLSSPGGPDVAPFQETITFGPDTSFVVVPVPIVNNGPTGTGDITIPLFLSSPSRGATLGATASASLILHVNSINNNNNNNNNNNSSNGGNFKNALPPLVGVASLQWPKIKATVGSGKKAKTRSQTVLRLQFSGPIGGAANLAAYQLLSGRVKKRVTTFNKPVRLISAAYDPTACTATLIPAGTLNLSQPMQLRVSAAVLTDAFGRHLAGGKDYVASFSKKGVTVV
jgi:hypothetical protein